jgi:hypothetical protein
MKPQTISFGKQTSRDTARHEGETPMQTNEKKEKKVLLRWDAAIERTMYTQPDLDYVRLFKALVGSLFSRLPNEDARQRLYVGMLWPDQPVSVKDCDSDVLRQSIGSLEQFSFAFVDKRATRREGF